MNFRTDEELVAFFKELFEDYFKISWGVKPAHIKILRNSEKVVNVEIISDFQTISATTEQLDKISKEFKTNLKIYVDGDIGHDAFAGDALHPFKTLQAAFDAIPIQSNFIVEIFAKNLKYIDRQINNEYGRKSYGILKHKHMRRLTIFIDDV